MCRFATRTCLHATYPSNWDARLVDSAADPPFGARGMPEHAAIATGEVGWRLEAAGGRDIHDGHGRLEQELPGPAQAHLEVVALRHAVEMAPEQAFDLAPRESRAAGDVLERERLLDVLFHELGDLDHAAV